MADGLKSQTSMRPRLNIRSPGIARQARRHERKLLAALAICIKRARTGDPQVSALLQSAKVEAWTKC